MTTADNPRVGTVQLVAVTLLFVALTAAMTWPQLEYLGTRAKEHQDVYFNMWRLRWFAHALETAPLHIFDGNIFHPEPRTLTYSDAMIVEGLVGAPLLWAGLPPMLVHNVLLLGAIVASGVGMFVLMQMLTGSSAAGILSAIVFAFVPYRFEHYMHMELQWTMWMPWSFWALHRTLATRSWRNGLLTGLFLSLQMLSSIYYGVFLSTLLGVCARPAADRAAVEASLAVHQGAPARSASGSRHLRRVRAAVPRDEVSDRWPLGGRAHGLQRASVELSRSDA